MLTLDPATLAEYGVVYAAADRAQAVLDALTAPVFVAVYDGEGQVMGVGEMGSPWATLGEAGEDGRVPIVVGELAVPVNVLVSGVPDKATWYLRFVGANDRYLQGTFGFAGSGADFTWSLGTWSAGQQGALGTVVCNAHDVPVQFDWAIPDLADVDYTTPPATEGVAGEFDLTPLLSSVAASSAILSRKAGDARISVNNATRKLTWGANLEADDGYYDVDVELWDGQTDASDAENDWIARSTGDGVVWAHDFRTAAEVANFLNIEPANSTTVHSPDGITGGSVMQQIPANLPAMIVQVASSSATAPNTAEITLSASIDLAVGDNVRVYNLPAPWAVMNNQEAGGVIKSYPVVALLSTSPYKFRVSTVVSHDHFSAYTFNPSGYATFNNSGSVSTIIAQRCRVSAGSWQRPMSALASGNGLSVPDRGIATLGMPGRVWNPASSAARTYNWRRDYYSHVDYRDQYGPNYPGIANWWDFDNVTQLTDNWRGSDFWLQFRLKISASRYQDSNALYRNSGGLKYLAAWTTWRTPIHECVLQDLNTPATPYANFPASVGGRVSGYTNNSVSKGFDDGPSMQTGGEFDATCRWSGGGQYPQDPGACFSIPPDEWVTFLLHVIPGKDYPDNLGWPVASNPATGTGVQLFAATQSRIDAMRNAGLTPTYQTIYNKIGANAFPFTFDNHGPSYATFPNKNEPPPGYNAILFWSYQNAIPQAYGFTRKLTQVIFKRGNGGTDPVADGIPCPRY